MVAPPWFEVPPAGYGGIEAICATLVDALTAHGHEVTLFGAGRASRTVARFASTMPEVQHRRIGEELPAALHTARVNRLLAAGRFDVIHDHTVVGPLTAAQRPAPTVVTLHGPACGELGDVFASVGGPASLVAISQAQRSARPDLPWLATVYHGVDADRFTVAANPDGPVLWLGRFCPDKGPDLAITACREAGLPLVLAGKCAEPVEERYFDQRVRPLLGDDVDLVHNADRATVNRLLAAARCLIMPIRWAEPFGMVMIEAMASGTPVVALRRGSVPEIVRHGVTGWICDDPSQLPEALRRVPELDPMACVSHVRCRFAGDSMARRYEQVYRDAIAVAHPNAAKHRTSSSGWSPLSVPMGPAGRS